MRESILSEIRNGVGVITLNRPEALNAMNLNMAQAINQVLTEWKDNDQVHLIVFQGSGEKAFCAGGDVRFIYELGEKGHHNQQIDFYRQEYAMDELIAYFPKPTLSLCAGITMGGGMGVAMNGRYRIVSDDSLWAMPECLIGFFPDVGAGHFLNECPGHIGMYAGLTGAHLNAAEALYACLATHYVPQEKMEIFFNTLVQAETKNFPEEVLQQSLEMFSESPDQENALHDNRAVIEDAFSENSVEEIISTLHRSNTKWADQTIEMLEKNSPLSLKITFAYLRHCRRKGLSAGEVLKLDFRLAQRFIEGKDFYEGVRARLIDRDHLPQWSPPKLEEVSDVLISEYLKNIT